MPCDDAHYSLIAASDRIVNHEIPTEMPINEDVSSINCRVAISVSLVQSLSQKHVSTR